MNQVPHFELPLRVQSDGSFAVLSQDFAEEIVQSVAVLLATELGERIEVPQYGVDPTLFKTEVDRDLIAQQVEEWEPRVIALLDDSPDEFDALIRRIAVRVVERSDV